MTDSNIAFSLALAQEYIYSDEQFPVDFDDAWQWLGYSTKQKAKVKLLGHFEQDLDFNVNQMVKVQNEGGRSVSRPYENICLSIDCFKSLGMMAGTDQGKLIRKYFLECEKMTKKVQPQFDIPKNFSEALFLAGKLQQEKEVLEAQALINKPKVEFANAIAFSDDSVEFHEYAKMIGTGRNRLMKRLREMGILMQNSTIPYQRYIEAGYFEASQEITPSGKLVPFALVTGKGQLWLHQKLNATQALAPVSSQETFDFDSI
jgi:phage antirepressor YoqD-like protein/phage anti-repressor protein